MNHENNLILIESLNNCATKASRCATACSIEEDTTITSSCQNYALDCAEICRLTASFASRNSKNTQYLLKECIEICKSCAHECEKFATISSCIECAVTCRECAQLCASFERTEGK